MRIVGTAVLGLMFMLFVGLDLVLFGVIATDSVIVTILAVLGLIGGGILGYVVSKRGSGHTSGHAAT